MEAQNILSSTIINAGTSVYQSRNQKEINLNIGEIQRNNPEGVKDEQRKFPKNACVLMAAAWMMSIHMVITLIEMLKYVISGAGPDGTSKIPEASFLMILAPLVLVFLLILCLIPDSDKNKTEVLDASSPDSLGILLTIYYFMVVLLMITMWMITIISFEAPGRTVGLFITLIDMIAGFYFIWYSCVLMVREKQLSEGTLPGLEIQNI